MLLEKLKALECSLHGVRRNDRQWLEQLLHPDFQEITRSGVTIGREETINSLLAENSTPGILSDDFSIIIIKEDVAILRYRTFYYDGSHPALRSSCWLRSAKGAWTLVFHQGTPEAGGEQGQG